MTGGKRTNIFCYLASSFSLKQLELCKRTYCRDKTAVNIVFFGFWLLKLALYSLPGTCSWWWCQACLGLDNVNYQRDMYFPKHHGELRKYFSWITFKRYWSQTKTLPKLYFSFYYKSQNITFSGAALMLLCLLFSVPYPTLLERGPPKHCSDSHSSSLHILAQVLAGLL